MIDLTPLDVRKKKGDFKRAMRGYETGLVDDFLELVADRLEDLVRENNTHADRLRQLEQQLRDYKERERALTDALVSAQELREEMREQAVREAELARRSAEQDAERIRATAAQQMEVEEQKLRRLRTRQAQFVQTYRVLLERELEELDVAAEALAYKRNEADAGSAAGAADESTASASAETSADMTQAAPADPAPAPAEVPKPAASAGPMDALQSPFADAQRGASASGDRIGDAELERSLEALQVVFARDQEVEEASLGWPEPELPADPASFYEPEALKAPYGEAQVPDAVPLALEEEDEYELLLEDAIDEESEPATDASAGDAWLPKLIEDEP